MHFFLTHTLFLTFGAFIILQSAIARPVINLSYDEHRIKCRGGHGKSALHIRSDINPLDALFNPPTTYQPGPTRLKLGVDACIELDRLGIHGKTRKNTINWHKKHIKKAMRTDPLLKNIAEMGVIEHIVHKGGSNPNEKNHITASFTNKDGNDIPNDFNDGRNHHIYVSNKSLPSHVKGAMEGANARINHKSRDHQVASGKTRTRGKSNGKGKGRRNPSRHFSKNPHKGYKQRGGK